MDKKTKRFMRAGIMAACITVMGYTNISVHAQPSSSDLAKQTTSLQNELNDLNSQLDDLITQMDNMSQEAEDLAAAMEETQIRFDKTQADGEAQYAAMKLRIKYIYEAGDSSFIELLCSAENMTDFLNKTDFVKSVSEYDRNMLNQLLATQEKLAEEGKLMEEQHQELVDKQDELAVKRTEIENLILSTSGELSNYSAQLERARQAELLASRQAAEQQAQASSGSGQSSEQTSSKPSTPPQEYTPGNSEGKQYLGSFYITHYCNCNLCCGSWANGPTASGTYPTGGRTIAVDPSVIPLGTRVIINGQVYVAEDTGGMIKGNKIDIYVPSHSLTTAYGTYNADVYLAD